MFLTLFALGLRVILVAKLVIIVFIIIFSIIIFTKSLSLLKSTGTGTNLSTYSSSTLLFKLFKPVGTFYQYISDIVVIHLLRSGLLFSTAVGAVLVAKLVILGILILTPFILAIIEALVTKSVILGTSFLTSVILGLRVVLVAKLVISGIFSSISLILALHTSFLASLFFTTLLSLLKSTGAGTNLSISN